MKRLREKCCSCPVNCRLVLDMLQIILLSIIHFGMEFTNLYVQDDGKGYYTGEYVWYMVINSLGFLVQTIALLRVLGFHLKGHSLRFYYGSCFLLLVSVASIVISLTYAQQPSCDKETNKNCNDDQRKMSSTKFGCEVAMFFMTCISGFLFLYAFSLTCCKEKPVMMDDNTETCPPGDPKCGSSRSSSKDNTQNANVLSRDEQIKKSWTAKPSAPPLTASNSNL